MSVLASSNLGTVYELDGHTIVIADRWRTGECRAGRPEECGQLGRLRDGWWIACSDPSHEDDDRLAFLIRTIENAGLAEDTPIRGGRSIIKAPRQCMCGCGGTTKGGRFLPGHDARLKSHLLKDAREGSESAVERIHELGWERFLDES